jgi:hypothetical protein
MVWIVALRRYEGVSSRCPDRWTAAFVLGSVIGFQFMIRFELKANTQQLKPVTEYQTTEEKA